MTDELKPCPFCGKHHTLSVQTFEQTDDEDLDALYEVICDFDIDGCGASGPPAETPEGAITNWNNRA